MTGEASEIPADPQPGGRQPAPGRLALVQGFLNTRFDLAASDHGETFTDPGALAAWLESRRLGRGNLDLDESDLARAIAVREGLRALAFANNGRSLDRRAVAEMRAASRGLQIGVGLEPEGPGFNPGGGEGLDLALGVLVCVAAEARLDGTWRRLKACPGRHCGWAFFDHSRNGSSRWCSMKVCGDRAKARAHYWRKAGEKAP
jgi:predicted RNA-binding Zn ribbon-like protein